MITARATRPSNSTGEVIVSTRIILPSRRRHSKNIAAACVGTNEIEEQRSDRLFGIGEPEHLGEDLVGFNEHPVDMDDPALGHRVRDLADKRVVFSHDRLAPRVHLRLEHHTSRRCRLSNLPARRRTLATIGGGRPALESTSALASTTRP